MTQPDPDSARAAADAEGLAGVVADLVTTRVALRYAWAAAMVAPGARVLDVGCGVGAGAEALAAAGGVVCGVDRPAVIAAVPARVRGVVELVPGSLDRLPVAAASFAVVVCVGGLDNGPDPKAAIEELVRVLAPGGLLVVAGTAARDLGAGEIDGETLQEMLTDRGFTVAAFSEPAWLTTSITASGAPITVEAGRPTPATLVLASTAPLPEPSLDARIASELGVHRLQKMERGFALALSTARAAAEAAGEERARVAAVEARLAAAERELAALVELEIAIGAALEERDDARAEVAAARADAQALRASTTWRATAPLRRLSARVRGKPYA